MSPRSGAGYEPLEGVDRGFESASVRLLGGRKRMGRYRALPGVTVTPSRDGGWPWGYSMEE